MPPLRADFRVDLKAGLAGAAVGSGAAVIIDVLRAFTTAAFAFDAGVSRIILVSTADEAFLLKGQDPSLLLVGESGGRTIAGFDVGNSPEAIEELGQAGALRGRSLVLRSSSGTQGVVAAARAGASPILLGSLVVAAATIRWLAANKMQDVAIVAMGSVDGPDGPEDVACRDYMAALAAGFTNDLEHVRRLVEQSPAGKMCVDPECDFKSPGDLARAVAIDRFDFAMPVHVEGGLLVARRSLKPYP